MENIIYYSGIMFFVLVYLSVEEYNPGTFIVYLYLQNFVNVK